ncbi:MAG TPA: ArsA-related P-loop ATPase [Thermoanaerobaculia bacterium]|nr:ArsA-related P-loop ATPase [Thermoanaerobaculia bacterium]
MRRWPELLVLVGAGGVGKTTVAAAAAALSARDGARTLVMTFDPSHRLRQALGVGAEAALSEVEVPGVAGGRLRASLLDARRTFDRLVERHAPDLETRDRILGNRFYRTFAGSLAGVLEYMAVERLFEVREAGRFDRIVLDTPPTREALDFLGAPRRIVDFLDSGLVRLAFRSWFDDLGRGRSGALGALGRRLESGLDEIVGIDLLGDMVEFIRAFGPLYEGFRRRAAEVEQLLRDEATAFVLVAGPGEERIPETLYFARRLGEHGCRLAGVLVNRVHPPLAGEGWPPLLAFLSRRDRDGLRELAGRLGEVPLWSLPLLGEEPSGLAGIERVAACLEDVWDGSGGPVDRVCRGAV